ncbi:MAG: DUF1036 domain-containing protein [Bdellovibrionales bacterium]
MKSVASFSFKNFLIAAPFFVLFAVSAPCDASAALSFCNRTSGAIEAALGYRSDDPEKADSWISEGWWRIEPGQCSRVLSEALTQRFYFYYGRALTQTMKDVPPTLWSGKYIFCIDNKAFRIDGDGDCSARKYQSVGFQQVDIGLGVRDYSLDFKDALGR